MRLQKLYEEKCRIDSDINQHIPVFKKYAEECDSSWEIVEDVVAWCDYVVLAK